jgi:hypothetical protein
MAAPFRALAVSTIGRAIEIVYDRSYYLVNMPDQRKQRADGVRIREAMVCGGRVARDPPRTCRALDGQPGATSSALQVPRTSSGCFDLGLRLSPGGRERESGPPYSRHHLRAPQWVSTTVTPAISRGRGRGARAARRGRAVRVRHRDPSAGRSSERRGRAGETGAAASR